MKELIDSPVFGIILSIIGYELGLLIYRKTKLPIFNPLFIAICFVGAFLLKFDISLDSYSKGGNLISIFLGPATVILAVPLYKQLNKLKANLVPILAGVFVGSITSIIGVSMLVKMFGISRQLGLSLIPKSITTPIGIELSKQLGGIPSVTVAAIILTGIMGSILAPVICRIFRITDKVAVGIAIGTSSHAVGTTKAVEIGEVEGAMSGLAIGVAGLLTVFVAPILVRWLG
ncbi:MAG: LrgB family protein [Clostridia bacterium]|nr:LrgB family protein [Clostridia bacterium]